MQTINTQDMETISNLMDLGHSRAVESFSLLLRQKVAINNHVTAVFDDLKTLRELLDHRPNDTVIVTQLIGDFTGESYLIFNEEEHSQISKLCIDSFGGESSGLTEEAVLKEIDNILSAAVITELSNQLKIRLFGDVPQIVLPGDIINSLGYGESLFFLSNSHFVLENHIDINPKFIWKLDTEFIKLANTQ